MGQNAQSMPLDCKPDDVPLEAQQGCLTFTPVSSMAFPTDGLEFARPFLP